VFAAALFALAALSPARAEPLRPLLFVPGTMGSKLCGPSGVVWGGIFDLESAESFVLNAPGSVPLAACGLLENFGIFLFFNVGIYGDFLDAMERAGYRRGKTLFDCPYDWRRSALTHGVEKMDECLARVRAANPDIDRTGVDVVGHSFGGVVARVYLDKGRDAGLFRRVVLVGSPQRGAVQVFETGRRGFNGLITMLLGGPQRLSQAAFSWESIYEQAPMGVLPERRGPPVLLRALGTAAQVQGQDCCFQQVRAEQCAGSPLDAIRPYCLAPLTLRAAETWRAFPWFPKSLSDEDLAARLNAAAQVQNIMARVPRRPAQMHYVYSNAFATRAKAVFDEAGDVSRFEMGIGDQTVPAESASNGATRGGAAAMAIGLWPVTAEHMTMMENDETIATVHKILGSRDVALKARLGRKAARRASALAQCARGSPMARALGGRAGGRFAALSQNGKAACFRSVAVRGQPLAEAGCPFRLNVELEGAYGQAARQPVVGLEIQEARSARPRPVSGGLKITPTASRLGLTVAHAYTIVAPKEPGTYRILARLEGMDDPVGALPLVVAKRRKPGECLDTAPFVE
jgi:pimeloyl-ACP methyl ester carboxylesterase